MANSDDIAETKAEFYTPEVIETINTAHTQEEQDAMLAENTKKLEDEQAKGDEFRNDTDNWLCSGDSCTNTEMRTVQSSAQIAFPNSPLKQSEFIKSYRASEWKELSNKEEDFTNLIKDPLGTVTTSIKEVATAVLNPINTGRAIATAISDWKKEYDTAIASGNAALAGKMKGELVSIVGTELAVGVILGTATTAATKKLSNIATVIKAKKSYDTRHQLDNDSDFSNPIIHSDNLNTYSLLIGGKHTDGSISPETNDYNISSSNHTSEYTVEANDSLSSIAQTHNIPVAAKFVGEKDAAKYMADHEGFG